MGVNTVSGRVGAVSRLPSVERGGVCTSGATNLERRLPKAGRRARRRRLMKSAAAGDPGARGDPRRMQPAAGLS
ncbi:hypothetical protein EVAR_85435_1 [Eumeta japonica]|uniref:Uncharacterized protein n=1 Tax=Eumeta variegata TaxID=151549 RepID=A0A4C1WJM6_EUMVA|nr:hypothetical protein EVAR_85435_1 [Eumeta japonica]